MAGEMDKWTHGPMRHHRIVAQIGTASALCLALPDLTALQLKRPPAMCTLHCFTAAATTSRVSTITVRTNGKKLPKITYASSFSKIHKILVSCGTHAILLPSPKKNVTSYYDISHLNTRLSFFIRTEGVQMNMVLFKGVFVN